MVTRLCPLAKLIDGSAGSLSFSIPPAALEALPELVEWIEDPTNQLNDWGITHTTLEEVFIRLARDPATATTEAPVAVPIRAASVEIENEIPTVHVQVPAGISPGMQFEVNVGGQIIGIACPQGAAPGSTIQSQVPAAAAAAAPVGPDPMAAADDGPSASAFGDKMPEGGDGGDGGGESKESKKGSEVDVENPMTISGEHGNHGERSAEKPGLAMTGSSRRSKGDAPRSPLARNDSLKVRDGPDGNPGGNGDLATDVPTRAKFGSLFRLQMWQRKRRKCNSACIFLCPTLTMVLLMALTLFFKVRVILNVILRVIGIPTNRA